MPLCLGEGQVIDVAEDSSRQDPGDEISSDGDESEDDSSWNETRRCCEGRHTAVEETKSETSKSPAKTRNAASSIPAKRVRSPASLTNKATASWTKVAGRTNPRQPTREDLAQVFVLIPCGPTPLQIKIQATFYLTIFVKTINFNVYNSKLLLGACPPPPSRCRRPALHL